jgi:hypothetical protein
MKKSKQLWQWIPEIYLILSVIYYWVMTGTFFNPIAITLLLVLTILIIRKAPTFGVIISILFLFLNLYMVLALVSELNEFHAFTNKARNMLLFGSAYLGLNIVLSIIMLRKWGGKISSASTAGSAEPIR